MNESTFWVVVPSLLIGLLGWIVTNFRQVWIAAIKARLHRELIARVATLDQLQAFLTSKEGQQLFSEGSLTQRLRERLAQSVQTGCILTVLGISLGAWRWVDPGVPVGVPIVVVGLGVGFLVASLATHGLYGRWAASEASSDPNAR